MDPQALKPPPAADAAPALAPGVVVPALGPVRLGDLVVDPPLLLAPMAGFTNVAFRRIARRLGCGLTATEMVMAEGVVRRHPRTMELAVLGPDERPGVVQIAGSDPAVMGEAARILVDGGAEAVDVNMGCPVRKIVDRAAGSALMRDAPRAAAIVAAVGRAGVPVTVKMRAGWDDVRQGLEVARALEGEGVAAITVHGRTRTQQYSGRADRDAIRAVKQAVRVPVFGNGDVVTPQDVLDMAVQTGVDGVMIGRAALWDPWIFAHAARALREGRVGEPPTAQERRAVLVEYFEETARARDERAAVLAMRKFAALYLRGFAGARRLRTRLTTMATREEFLSLVGEVFSAEAGADGP